MEKNNEKSREVLRLSNEESNRITRECLQSALIHLMGKKDFERITVSELVQRAGVSRTSFYRNYSAKEDILMDMAKTVGYEVLAILSGKGYENDRRRLYLDFFSEIRSHAEIIGPVIRVDIQRYVDFERIGLFKGLFKPTTTYENYAARAFEGAMISIAYVWFNNGMKESDEYMADCCARLLSPYTGYLDKFSENNNVKNA